jgi:hypothetical protein
MGKLFDNRLAGGESRGLQTETHRRSAGFFAGEDQNGDWPVTILC